MKNEVFAVLSKRITKLYSLHVSIMGVDIHILHVMDCDLANKLQLACMRPMRSVLAEMSVRFSFARAASSAAARVFSDATVSAK